MGGLDRELPDRGIRLKVYGPGEHRAACPECAKGTRRKHDDALAVRIDHGGGATWICHRCEWTGGIGGERRRKIWDRSENLKWGAKPPDPAPAPDPDPEPVAQILRSGIVNHPLAPQRSLFAVELWDKAAPIWGTPAEIYLRSRGLVPADADRSAAYPWERLRYLPRCPFDRERHTALIVAIDHVTGWLVGIQRIALTLNGQKAPLPKPKMALGPVKGNAARLGDHRNGDTLAFTEGVEDALAYQLLTGMPTWAACGAGMIKSIVLPTWIANVVIVADADDPGLKAAAEALLAFRSQGRNVRVVRAIGAKDPAELVEREAAA